MSNYVDMNYKLIYDNIIENRKCNIPEKCYTENHHIKPISLGGINRKSNVVKLTAREHFICHYLLTKIYPIYSFEWQKMNHAFMFMKGNNIIQYRYFNSRLYEYSKCIFSKMMREKQLKEKNTQYNTRWISNIELKKDKKIKNGDIIPEGWVLGRKKWKCYHLCPVCEEEVFNYNECCSRKCSNILRCNRLKSGEIKKGGFKSGSYKHSDESKEKLKHSRNKGKNNPMYGKRFIFNPDSKKLKVVLKEEPTPKGWEDGMKNWYNEKF